MPANYEEGRPGGGPKKGSKKGSKMAKNGHFGCTFDYTQGLAGTPFLGVPEGPFCPYFPRLTPSQIGSVLDPILTPWPWDPLGTLPGVPGGQNGRFCPDLTLARPPKPRTATLGPGQAGYPKGHMLDPGISRS